MWLTLQKMQYFKYTLDRSSKKYVCPNCDKKTFVLYVDAETGNYLTTDYGRCDREQNCHYHKAPPKGKRAYLIAFLALKPISNLAAKLTDVNGIVLIVPKSQILEAHENDCWITEWYLKTSTINYTSKQCKYFNTNESVTINDVKTIEQPQASIPSFHSLDVLNEMYIDNYRPDNLTEYLKTKFTPYEVYTATQNYFLTGTNYFWSNATVFWQIDNKEQIHAGKVMLYNAVTGKRIKEPCNCINWLHKAVNETDFTLSQCLFGLHRVNEDYQKTIAIVESEKTAIIMSIILPEFIWMATGSKSNFKIQLLKPIKKRSIVAFPDKGELINWERKAAEFNKLGYKIAVSKIIENTEFNNGFDLADYYLQALPEHNIDL